MTEKPVELRAVFDRAWEIQSPGERTRYLDEACDGDPQARRKIEELLANLESAGSFLEKPPPALLPTVAMPPIAEGPGTMIGPYKLLQTIGEGGMGVVYMAEQQEPVRRRVALKIIKPGMDSKAVVARFQAERQALALMDHPNIARVLDAGTVGEGDRSQGAGVRGQQTDGLTPDSCPLTPGIGRPYFVMELVKGVPITEYCDKNSLPARERLELFVTVCHAVQHAHQKGIIHRDIKPSNVLVTLHDGKPVPKIIDFGIAKAIDRQLTEKTLFTAFGEMIGTPQYMSPEQAEMSGLDVDTRSDIYSLGVLLYELLTGSTPFDAARLRGMGYAEMQRIIVQEEPPRPSVRLSTLGEKLTIVAKHRSADPQKLSQLVRGDLDWIVMRSLEKERGRRYDTANSFAADIGRFLRDEPIEARPPSVAYRMRKFVRRNRSAVAAAAAIVLALLAAVAGTSIGLVRAQLAARQAWHDAERARQAEKLADHRLVEVGRERDAANKARKLADGARREALINADVAIGHARQADSLRLAAESAAVLPENPGRALLLAIAATERAPKRGVPHDQALLHALDECREEQTLFAPPIAGEGSRSGRTAFHQLHVSRDGRRTVVCASRFSDPSEMYLDQERQENAYVYDLESGQVTASVKYLGLPFYTSALSPDGKLLAGAIHHPSICRYADGTFCGYTERVVRLFDVNTGKEVRVFAGHVDRITSVSFSSDGLRLLTSSLDATARVWDVQTGKVLQVFQSPEEKVHDEPPFPGAPLVEKATLTLAQFNADGSRVLTVDGGKSSWDAREKKSLRDHGFSGAIPYDKVIVDPPLRDEKAAQVYGCGHGETGAYWRSPLIRLWDAAGGALLATLADEDEIRRRGISGYASKAAFTPDGKYAVTTYGYANSIRLWQASDGKKLADSATGRGEPGVTTEFRPPPNPFCHELVHEGMRIATLEHEMSLLVWQKYESGGIDSRTSEKFARHWGYPQGTQMLAAGQSKGAPLAAIADGRNVVVREATPEGKTVAVLKGHEEAVSDAAFMPGGDKLISVAYDGTLRTWRLAPHEHTVEIREPQLGYARFVPRGRLLTAGTMDQYAHFDSGDVSLWDLATKKKIEFDRRGEDAQSIDPNSIDARRLGYLTDLDLNPDGNRMVTVHHDLNPRDISIQEPPVSPLFTPVRVWDAHSGKLLFALEGLRRSVLTARFSPDGTKLLTFADGRNRHLYLVDGKPYGAGSDGGLFSRVDLWDSQSGKHIRTLVDENERGGGHFALWNPDGRRIVTDARIANFAARIFDAASGEVVCTLGKLNTDNFDRAAYSPDGNYVLGFRLLWTEGRETALLFSATTGEMVAKLSGHRGDITFAALSADGSKVLTTSSDQTARLWKMPGGEELLVLRGHEGRINHGASSPDGRYVATASADGSARIWDAASGELKHVFHAPPRAKMLSVQFNPDSGAPAQLLTVSDDKAARIWTLDLLPLARRLAPREPTEGERGRYEINRPVPTMERRLGPQ